MIKVVVLVLVITILAGLTSLSTFGSSDHGTMRAEVSQTEVLDMTPHRIVPRPENSPRQQRASRSRVRPNTHSHQGLTTGSEWDRLAKCESGGKWDTNTGNGYYGGIQFDLTSWHEAGGEGYPHQASKAEQIKRGEIWKARYGWNPWPACARKLGFKLRGN